MLIRDPDTDTPLIAKREELNFFHQSHCSVSIDMTAFEAYCQMTAKSTRLLQAAFWLCDRISALAGVLTIGGTDSRPQQEPAIGEKLDFFDVVGVNADEIFLSSVDRHLSTLLVIKLEHLSVNIQKLTITPSVKTHNFFGELYMLPVAPAHKVIVRRMLLRLTESAKSPFENFMGV